MTVEEKTSISWMAPATAGGDRKTPSAGLPPARPLSGPAAAELPLYEDGETVQVTELQKGGPATAGNVPRSSPVATTLKGGDPVPPLPPGAVLPSSASGTASSAGGPVTAG